MNWPHIHVGSPHPRLRQLTTEMILFLSGLILVISALVCFSRST